MGLLVSHRRGRIASARDDGISFVGADAIRPYERNPTPYLFVYPLTGIYFCPPICLLPTAYCLLPTAYCLLPTAY